MDKAWISIDDYVESLYSGLNDDGDAADLKEEMRDHLQDAAKRLRDEGYSEEDSVRIAIERFGDQASVKSDLSSLYPTPEQGQTPPPDQDIPSGTDGPRQGISALVYAILAVFIPVVGIVFAIVALTRAIRNLRRPTPRTVAPMVSGLAIGIAILALLWQLFYILGIGAFTLLGYAGHSGAVSTSATQSTVGGP